MKLLYYFEGIFDRLRSDQWGNKALNSRVKIIVTQSSGSFCYVQVLFSTKSKKLTRTQYFITPGILMRGRSQPVEGFKVPAQNPHFYDISVGKKIRVRRKMMKISQK